MFFDPIYFIGPAVLLAIYAQVRVKSTYHEAMRLPTRGGLTGAQAARRLLDADGLRHVRIEPVDGYLSDHYDPRSETLRLSPDVFGGSNLAAVGIAAHEAGHAIQKAHRYGPLAIRNGLVPLAATGGQISTTLIFIGLALTYAAGGLGRAMLLAGIALYAITVLFQIVNLPVEFDASRRAKLILVQNGIIAADELRPVDRVLSAAALTYVAATLTAVMSLLYFLWRAGLLGGRRD